MEITENSTQEQELTVNLKLLALELFKIVLLPSQDRGIDGLVYLNKIYSKYITLVEKSSIINQFDKKDQLLVIDSKLLISNDEDTILTNNSNDNNPIISNKEKEL